MRKPPPFGRGLLRSTLVVWLGRACPRSDANKAQDSKEQYYEQAGLCHEGVNVNEPGTGSGCGQGTNFRPVPCGKLSFPMPKTMAQKLWGSPRVRSAQREQGLRSAGLHVG